VKHPGIFICAISLILPSLAYAGRTGDEIKIYATGRDMQSIVEDVNSRIADANSQIAPEPLTVRVVDKESDADVSITFQEDIGNPGADAVSYTYRGHIYIANSAPADALSFILLHELSHCAGVDHEPDDPTSIMFTHTHKHGQLKEWHIRNLRRLAGVTGPERVIAQLRVLL
jgi:hypothetical protein